MVALVGRFRQPAVDVASLIPRVFTSIPKGQIFIDGVEVADLPSCATCERQYRSGDPARERCS